MQTYDEWLKENEEKERQLKAELEKLKSKLTEAALNVRFLRDFGCVNFRGEEFTHELRLAGMWHDEQKAKHPELHEQREYEPHNCYHVTKCSCGFSSSVDSSG